MVTEITEIKIATVAVEPICAILLDVKGSSGVAAGILTEEGRVVFGRPLDQEFLADWATYGWVWDEVHF